MVMSIILLEIKMELKEMPMISKETKTALMDISTKSMEMLTTSLATEMMLMETTMV